METTFAAALREAMRQYPTRGRGRRGPGALRWVALEANVAPGALAKILAGKYPVEIDPSYTKSRAKRIIDGAIGTLTRLCDTFSIDLAATLEEYGLPYDESVIAASRSRRRNREDERAKLEVMTTTGEGRSIGPKEAALFLQVVTVVGRPLGSAFLFGLCDEKKGQAQVRTGEAVALWHIANVLEAPVNPKILYSVFVLQKLERTQWDPALFAMLEAHLSHETALLCAKVLTLGTRRKPTTWRGVRSLLAAKEQGFRADDFAMLAKILESMERGLTLEEVLALIRARSS